MSLRMRIQRVWRNSMVCGTHCIYHIPNNIIILEPLANLALKNEPVPVELPLPLIHNIHLFMEEILDSNPINPKQFSEIARGMADINSVTSPMKGFPVTTYQHPKAFTNYHGQIAYIINLFPVRTWNMYYIFRYNPDLPRLLQVLFEDRAVTANIVSFGGGPGPASYGAACALGEIFPHFSRSSVSCLILDYANWGYAVEKIPLTTEFKVKDLTRISDDKIIKYAIRSNIFLFSYVLIELVRGCNGRESPHKPTVIHWLELLFVHCQENSVFVISELASGCCVALFNQLKETLLTAMEQANTELGKMHQFRIFQCLHNNEDTTLDVDILKKVKQALCDGGALARANCASRSVKMPDGKSKKVFDIKKTLKQGTWVFWKGIETPEEEEEYL